MSESKLVSLAARGCGCMTLAVELIPELRITWEFTGGCAVAVRRLKDASTALDNGEPVLPVGAAACHITGDQVVISFNRVGSNYKIRVPVGRYRAILTKSLAIATQLATRSGAPPVSEMRFESEDGNGITVCIEVESTIEDNGDDGKMWWLIFRRYGSDSKFEFTVNEPQDIPAHEWRRLVAGPDHSLDLDPDGRGCIDVMGGNIMFGASVHIDNGATCTGAFALSALAPQLLKAIDAAEAAKLFD
jgi:hypothetical protein